MKLSLRTILENNLILKLCALIFGVSFWIMFGSLFNKSYDFTVPISFYGNSHTKVTQAPESITIRVTGNRVDIQNLDLTALALHINLDELEAGDQVIDVTQEKLFLPNNIKLVHWFPSNPIITIAKMQDCSKS